MLKRFVWQLRRGERGQNLVEFAIVVPVLVLMVMGIVDFGRAFNTWLMVTHGAREGARYAAVGYSDAQIVSQVQTTTPDIAVQVSISPGQGGRIQGQPVSVTVSTQMMLLTGIIADFFVQNPFPLISTAEMRYEGPQI